MWTITIETERGEHLALTHGGAKLLVEGRLAVEAPPGEYAGIYRAFAGLIERRASDCDLSPLRLVADAALLGRHHATVPFDW